MSGLMVYEKGGLSVFKNSLLVPSLNVATTTVLGFVPF